MEFDGGIPIIKIKMHKHAKRHFFSLRPQLIMAKVPTSLSLFLLTRFIIVSCQKFNNFLFVK